MAKVLRDNIYPDINRRVVRVVLNPEAPKWVHADGSAAPVTHTGDTSETGKTLCHECRYNWQEREFIWDGADAKKPDDEIQQEIKRMLTPRATPQHGKLEGKSLR